MILHYITLHYTTLHHITLHYITLHHITLHYITLHYITLHYSKGAWFELSRKKSKKMSVRGGGLSQEFSPSTEPAPTISHSGVNDDQELDMEALQRDLYVEIDKMRKESGICDYIFPDRNNAKSQVRDTISQRYSNSSFFFI